MRGIKKVMIRAIKVIMRYSVGMKNIYEIRSDKLVDMLREGKTLKDVMMWDGKYNYVDFKTMLNIVKDDWTHIEKYRKDVFDCDNFAMAFASHVTELYGINAVGIAIGHIADAKTNKIIGYHAWNVFIANTSKGTRLYIYEPQAGKFTDYKYARINAWKYIPEKILWL